MRHMREKLEKLLNEVLGDNFTAEDYENLKKGLGKAPLDLVRQLIGRCREIQAHKQGLVDDIDLMLTAELER